MAKKSKQNAKIIILIISAIAGIGALMGSYFIGFNVGINNASNFSNPTGDSSSEITGVYTRSYYNNYNKSRIDYVILKENGACNMTGYSSESASTVDLNAVDEYCSYTYDTETKNGTIIIDHYEQCAKLNPQQVEVACGKDRTVFSYDFSYMNGTFVMGGAVYYRLR